MKLDRFIDLDRRFLDVTELEDSETAAFESYSRELFGREPGLDWKALLLSRIVVILGEAGSGKTWELRYRAGALRKEGAFAFFVPLDGLVDSQLIEVLAPEDEGIYRKWKDINLEAIFFLDSVDEAKVRKQHDFVRALDSFVRGVGLSALQRLRVVVSSRISEWRSHTDRDELLQRLGDAIQDIKEEEFKDDESPAAFRIVQLESLDRERVRKFAEKTGLPNPESFIDAIDMHHAWEFARRPIDVGALANYWCEHGKLGSLTELIEFDLSNNLKETPERKQNDPLSPQPARIGAECLGAAVVLCRRFTFFVPDSVPPEDPSGGMVMEECLPDDWSPPMCRAMIARPLFDGATYGRVRFHHRRVAEYLAGRWLEKRMREGCPYPVLEELLFVRIDHRRMVPPSFRPMAAWLASGEKPWNQRVREQILECAPDLFFKYGDPESLPVDYRQSVLEHFIQHYADRDRVFADVEADSLARLADPQLAGYVKNILEKKTSSLEVRIILLRLIRHGRLHGCLDMVLKIIESPDECSELKSYALAAIRDVGNKKALIKLKDIVQGLETMSAHHCSLICEALYPDTLDPAELTALLRKSQRVERRSVNLPWNLKNLLERNLPPNHVSPLLQELVQLAEEYPRIRSNDKETPISDQFYWLGEIITMILTRLLKREHLFAHEVDLAAKALWLLGHFKHYGQMDKNLPGNLNTLLEQHPKIRRAYVWRSIDQKLGSKKDRMPHLYAVFGYYEVVDQWEGDIDWLIEDIRVGSTPERRKTALKLAVDLYYSTGSKRSTRRRIRNAVKWNVELKKQFKKQSYDSPLSKLKRFFNRHGIYNWKDTVWKLKDGIRNRCSELHYQIGLWHNIKKLRNGTALNALRDLAREAGGDPTQRGARSWKPLIVKRGKRIAQAASCGWKAFWLTFTPLLPHEKPNPNATDRRIGIGLSGINVSLADGDLEFATLNAEGARIACHYGVNEWNGFAEWLPDLAKAQPTVVRDVLTECVRAEWKIPADGDHVQEVLRALRYHGNGLVSLVSESIFAELRADDPLNTKVLEDALCILMKLPNPPRLALAKLAAQRTVSQQNDDDRFILWLSVWIQLDSGPAISYLDEALEQKNAPADLMVQLCGALEPRSDWTYPLIENPDYLQAGHLKELIHLTYRYIRFKDDINRTHGGMYSPTALDDAQRFRDGLIEKLAQVEGKEAEETLRDLANDPEFKDFRDWIHHLIDRRMEYNAESPPWQPTDIKEFMLHYEINPQSEHDLFRIACNRFVAIKDEVERGDISARDDLHIDDPESRLRSWLARQLRNCSRDRYTVPQEEEIDLQQRPDLRIETPGMGPVSVEIKWADNWSFNELEAGLSDQLVGQYLRAPNSSYGIYVLGYKKKKQHWIDVESGERFSFERLVEHLQKVAHQEVKKRHDDINGLEVFGINFAKPGS